MNKILFLFLTDLSLSFYLFILTYTIKQADEMGKSFKATSTHFTHLYSSDLMRAHSTALAILKHQTTPAGPSLLITPKIREIRFGIAEGQPYTHQATIHR
jgi:broad specificity phosphatase PhoE